MALIAGGADNEQDTSQHLYFFLGPSPESPSISLYTLLENCACVQRGMSRQAYQLDCRDGVNGMSFAQILC